MNRELKFRAWAHCDEGLKMVYFDTMDCDNGLWFSSFEHIDEYKDTIMQFTGLKDKNGVDIYEGDICFTDISRKHWVIVIHNYSWAFDNSSIKDNGTNKSGGNEMYYFHEYLQILKKVNVAIQVIGNIYENSELLN